MTTVCLVACVILGLFLGTAWGISIEHKMCGKMLTPIVKAVEMIVSENEEYTEYVKIIKQRELERLNQEIRNTADDGK